MTMTLQEQSPKILRGIELTRQIKLLTEELDALKAEFRSEAEQEIRRAGTGELPGQSWTFNTEPREFKALVSFPKIGLLRELFFINKIPHRYAEDPKTGDKVPTPIDCDVREVCGEHFTKLWTPFYRPAKAFPELVQAMIEPKARAQRLLRMLEEPPRAGSVKFDVVK